MPKFNQSTLLIIAAFFAIYIIWGSTFLFSAFAMDELPPFFMAGSRYLSAGLLLFSITFVLGKVRPITRLQWRNSIFAAVSYTHLTLPTKRIV